MNAEQPHVLLLEDRKQDGETISRLLRRKGYVVCWERTGKGAIRAFRKRERWAALVFDANLRDHEDLRQDTEYFGVVAGLLVLKDLQTGVGLGPECLVVMLTSHVGAVQSALRDDFPEVQVDEVVSKAGFGARIVAVSIARRLQQAAQTEQTATAPKDLLEPLSGLDPVLDDIREAAGNDVPVLLYGEPGVGKESLAHYAFSCSGRAGTLEMLSVGALDGESATFALCGRAAGFPDPRSKGEEGIFERAGYGMVYISDLDKYTDNSNRQVNALFTVLATNEADRYITRMGGKDMIPVRCGVIVSVNNPDALHPALLDRFHQIRVPPLRERPQDIEPLARFLWRRIRSEAGAMGEDLDEPSDAVFVALRQHPMPGNVRDLERWARTGRLPGLTADLDVTDASPPGTGKALHLSVRLGPDGRARYADLLGQDGSLKRAYWSWLKDLGLDLTAMAHATGMPRGQVVAQLRRFEISVNGLDEEPVSGE